MSEERLKVLEMLKEGTITTDDALKLLQGLDQGDEADSNGPRPSGRQYREHDNRQQYTNENRQYRNDDGGHYGYNNRQYRSRPSRGHINADFGWINELKDSIVESVKDITSEIDNGINTPFDFGMPNVRYTCESEKGINEIKSLKLSGKNDKIEIVATDDDFIRIDAIFKARSNMDPMIEFHQFEGNYEFLFDNDAVHSMGLRVWVPAIQIGELFAQTKNSDVYINGVKADSADLITKNASVQVENFTGAYLNVETKNAPIYLKEVSSQEIEAQTSNAKLDVRVVNAGNARLVTSNGNIKIDTADIRYIMSKTSNSSIKFSNLVDMAHTQYPQYTIEAYTSNANISIELPPGTEISSRVSAKTSYGRIATGLKNLMFMSNDKNNIEAKSPNFDEAIQKLDIMLKTSNGNIDIIA